MSRETALDAPYSGLRAEVRYWPNRVRRRVACERLQCVRSRRRQSGSGASGTRALPTLAVTLRPGQAPVATARNAGRRGPPHRLPAGRDLHRRPTRRTAPARADPDGRVGRVRASGREITARGASGEEPVIRGPIAQRRLSASFAADSLGELPKGRFTNKLLSVSCLEGYEHASTH